MKNARQRINKRGFTLIELMAAMVIIAVILGAVIAAVQGATNTSRITSTVATIKALQTAAVNYYNANGGTYSSGSLASGNTLSLANLALAANGMLPAGVTGTNAWGGTITVQPDAGNALYFDILLSNVPSTAQTSLQNAVSNIVQSTPTLSKAGVWQGVF